MAQGTWDARSYYLALDAMLGKRLFRGALCFNHFAYLHLVDLTSNKSAAGTATSPEMSKAVLRTPTLSSILVILLMFPLSRADVGTAGHYNPPYTPTACYGVDPSQFPSSNLFAAAGEGIWDNGAACGREYLVKCISSAVAGTCSPDQTIQVRIIDSSQSSTSRPSLPTATIVLSTTAFGTIAQSSVASINVEYQLV